MPRKKRKVNRRISLPRRSVRRLDEEEEEVLELLGGAEETARQN